MLLNRRIRTLLMIACLVAGLASLAGPAGAIARYTDETGVGCAECHTLHPQVTPRMLAWRVAVKLEIPFIGDTAGALLKHVGRNLDRLVRGMLSRSGQLSSRQGVYRAGAAG